MEGDDWLPPHSHLIGGKKLAATLDWSVTQYSLTVSSLNPPKRLCWDSYILWNPTVCYDIWMPHPLHQLSSLIPQVCLCSCLRYRLRTPEIILPNRNTFSLLEDSPVQLHNRECPQMVKSLGILHPGGLYLKKKKSFQLWILWLLPWLFHLGPQSSLVMNG